MAGQIRIHPRKRSLRAKAKLASATKPLPTTPKPIVTQRRLKEDKMHALALELGYFCQPATTFLVDLATRTAAAIRPRGSKFVYQSAAYSMESFPLELARQTFAMASVDSATPPGTTTWRMETMWQTALVFASIFTDGPSSCSGASKAFKSNSEPVIRVIATIMPGAVVSHVVLARGVERLYVNLNYSLQDEDGELHAPKDPNRNEIALTPEEVHEIRAQAATDAAVMGESGLPLSAGWWYQLGNAAEALMAEALLQNVSTAPVPAPGKQRRRADSYEIEKILQEQRGWYLVRWSGYHASWEAWRLSGEVGSPLETWEQLRSLKNTEAMAAWRESG